MKRIYNSARSVIAVAAALGLSAACSDLKDDLLEPQQPGVITPEAAASPTGADALRKGALGRLRTATEGADGLWLYSGLLADEWKSGDTFIQRVETDQRQIQDNNANINGVYVDQHRLRGAARDAIAALTQYLPDPNYLGQMWFVMGVAELQLAENWCNGVPYSIIVDGVPSYATPSTSAQGFTLAMTHLDSAAALVVAPDTLVRAIQIARARVLINQGSFAAAAAAVATIPTTFRYLQTHSLTVADAGAWNFNNSVKRWVVGDSFDTSGRILNAIPFASAGDPRVPVIGLTGSATGPGSAGRAFDNVTNFVYQQVWRNREDAVPLWNGIDARLIEAENQLQLGNLAAMTAILNTLRGSAQYLGSTYNSPVMAALATPGSQAAGQALFFREKAFWQFGRGWRAGDLRRLIRQYGQTEATTFPGGTFFKTLLPYGSDIAFPVTSSENANPNYVPCIDKNA